jgi:hypothetical protein
MSSREFRVAENESAFRLLDERLAAGTPSETFKIVCECGDEGCRERILVMRGEYEHARSDGALFLVQAGHEALDVEEIVAGRATTSSCGSSVARGRLPRSAIRAAERRRA